MASDYKSKPYAPWLEAVLPELIEHDPTSIAIVGLKKDGTVGTVYYNTENSDRAIMIQAIAEDSLIELIKVNAQMIADIINGEGGEV